MRYIILSLIIGSCSAWSSSDIAPIPFYLGSRLPASARAAFLGALEEVARAPESKVTFKRVRDPRKARVKFWVERVMLPLWRDDIVAVTKDGNIVIFWKQVHWHRGFPTWARTKQGKEIIEAAPTDLAPEDTFRRMSIDLVCLHELCHALGLPHSTDPDSPRYQGRPSILTHSDVLALNAVVENE